MSKAKKLYNLRTGIMNESEKVIILLEQLLNGGEVEAKIYVLAGIALEKSRKISKMNENIGRILKH